MHALMEGYKAGILNASLPLRSDVTFVRLIAPIMHAAASHSQFVLLSLTTHCQAAVLCCLGQHWQQYQACLCGHLVLCSV
jgi:hypothetical protein